MADPVAFHHGEHSSRTSSDATPPNHLGTTVPTGQFDDHSEKGDYYNAAMAEDPEKQDVLLKDDEDVDMDALIEDLESNSGDVIDEEADVEAGGPKPVPEELLQTELTIGLSDEQVIQRRKKYGLNQMKEEKVNHFLKFLGYFVGPIQFVMEVSPGISKTALKHKPLLVVKEKVIRSHDNPIGCRGFGRWSARMGRLCRDPCPVAAQRHGWLRARVSGRLNR